MNKFMTVDDVAEELEISRSRAYQLMRQYNRELQKEGYFVIPGKLSREYLSTKIFGGCKGKSEVKEP